jgi:hypothetical protein
MIHMAWSETCGCYNICRFPIDAVFCVFDATFNNISEIYFFICLFRITTQLHRVHIQAVLLKYDYVHITI